MRPCECMNVDIPPIKPTNSNTSRPREIDRATVNLKHKQTIKLKTLTIRLTFTNHHKQWTNWKIVNQKFLGMSWNHKIPVKYNTIQYTSLHSSYFAYYAIFAINALSSKLNISCEICSLLLIYISTYFFHGQVCISQVFQILLRI